MKKLIALLLVLVLALSLAACGGNDDIRGKTESNKDDAKETTSAASSTDGSGNTESKPTNKENQFNTGSVKTNKYTNDFAGIQLELDSNWTFLTDAEIEEQNKQAMGLVGDDYKELMKNANSFTDMQAAHSNGTDSINVGFEKIPVAYANMTEEEYVSMQTDDLKGGLESMGFTNVVVTTSKAQFAGKEHACVDVSCQINGVAFFERMAIVKCQGYMVTVTAGAAGTNITKNMLDAFKAI